MIISQSRLLTELGIIQFVSLVPIAYLMYCHTRKLSQMQRNRKWWQNIRGQTCLCHTALGVHYLNPLGLTPQIFRAASKKRLLLCHAFKQGTPQLEYKMAQCLHTVACSHISLSGYIASQHTYFPHPFPLGSIDVSAI